MLLLMHGAVTTGRTSTGGCVLASPLLCCSAAVSTHNSFFLKSLCSTSCFEVVQATPTGPAHWRASHQESLTFDFQCHRRGQSGMLAFETRKVDRLFIGYFMCVVYQSGWILAPPGS